MESTGADWNILAEQFEALLVNAQHIKAVPGRKTDQERQRVDRGLAAARIAPRAAATHPANEPMATVNDTQ
jgi:hypothetical protein